MSPINSYGGYGVYGLVTQTNRFDAAVALAGSCDLISLYGSLDAWYRYDDSSHERLFQATLLETGQGRMGSPPWKDAGRYLLNSPIFFVDRVQTPLLIIHGDMDYIPIQQGEEFFGNDPGLKPPGLVLAMAAGGSNGGSTMGRLTAALWAMFSAPVIVGMRTLRPGTGAP